MSPDRRPNPFSFVILFVYQLIDTGSEVFLAKEYHMKKCLSKIIVSLIIMAISVGSVDKNQLFVRELLAT